MTMQSRYVTDKNQYVSSFFFFQEEKRGWGVKKSKGGWEIAGTYSLGAACLILSWVNFLFNSSRLLAM